MYLYERERDPGKTIELYCKLFKICKAASESEVSVRGTCVEVNWVLSFPQTAVLICCAILLPKINVKKKNFSKSYRKQEGSNMVYNRKCVILNSVICVVLIRLLTRYSET